MPEYPILVDDGAVFTLIGIFAIIYLAYLAMSAAHHKFFNADALAQPDHSDLNWSEKEVNKHKQTHKKAIEVCSDAIIIVLGLLSIAIVSLALASFIFALVCLFLALTTILTTPSQIKSADRRTVYQITDYLASIFFVLLFCGLLFGILVFNMGVFITVYALVIGRALIQASHRVAKSI